jgi:hypothetical protein
VLGKQVDGRALSDVDLLLQLAEGGGGHDA